MSGLHVTQHIMTPHYANTKNNDSALYKQTKLLQLVQKFVIIDQQTTQS